MKYGPCGIFSTDDPQRDATQIACEQYEEEYDGQDSDDPCYCQLDEEGGLIECGYCKEEREIWEEIEKELGEESES